MIAWMWFAGCAEYEVELLPLAATPAPVEIASGEVRLPAGILATVTANGLRNGEVVADADIALVSGDDGVLIVEVVADADATFALGGYAPGATEILPEVDGHDAAPITVIVTEPVSPDQPSR